MLRLLIVFLLLPTPVMADLLPFRAEYTAKFKGLPVRATGVREVVKTETGDYRFSSIAKSFVAEVSESSLLTVTGQTFAPSLYQYARKGMGRNKEEDVRFDWSDLVAHHDGTHSALEPGTFDKLSYQLKLKADVAEAYRTNELDRTFEYLIADEEKRRLYRFEVIGEETLTTPLGQLNAIRLDRIREDKPRHTSLWLATDHDFLLLRLVQTEEIKGFELNIKSASINGESVKVATSSAE